MDGVGGERSGALPGVSAAIFAGNRAHGRVALEMRRSDGVTRAARLREEGSLRIRFPHAAPQDVEAVLVNTAGGVAGGDRFAVDVTLGADACLTISTAAAEKVYRSHGPDAHLSLRVDAASGAHLSWLPQETILFERSRMRRRIEVELAEDASLVLAESMVFGRSAMGEAVTEGSFVDHWRIRRGGRLIFADSLRLRGAVAQKLASRAVAAAGAAIATILLVPGSAEQVDAVRDAECHGVERGVSCWNDMLVARLCARDGQALREAVTAALTALEVRLPRLWT